MKNALLSRSPWTLVAALFAAGGAPAAASDAPSAAAAPAALPASVPAALTGPQVGAPAPAFSLRTIDGKTVSLDQYRGKTLVVNVWATWCPPCRGEMPDLIKTYPGLHANGVEFLGVDTTEEAPIVRAYAVARGLPYAQAVDTDKSFEKAYDIQYFPTTFVIDPQGVLRARYIDVISPLQLQQLTAAAQAGRNGEIVSPLQAKIDAVLTDPSIVFDGDATAIAAAVKKANDAIAKADKLMDDSDAAKGNPTDLLRTQSEQAALRDRAIAALSPIATSDADKILLATMRGDAARDREQWDAALAEYRTVVTLDPKNEDAWSGLAFAADRLEQFDVAIEADRKIVALDPDNVPALVDLGITLGHVKQFDEASATFNQAIALAEKHVAAKPGDPVKLRQLAWTHLYAGRTYAKAHWNERARTEFAAVVALAGKLPPHDARRDMYLEEGQEAIVALDLDGTTKTALSLAPWTGADLPGSVPNTIKYRLVVAGAAGKNVALQAAGVPKGWVASFCTDRVCAPFKVSVAIPASGVKIIEFQLVPPEAGAKPSKVRVTGTDGAGTATATT